MSKVTSETAFEDSIEQHLLDTGWHQGSPATFNRKLGLDPAELAAFVATSQPDEWEKLTQMLGGPATATEKVATLGLSTLVGPTMSGLVGSTRGRGWFSGSPPGA